MVELNLSNFSLSFNSSYLPETKACNYTEISIMVQREVKTLLTQRYLLILVLLFGCSLFSLLCYYAVKDVNERFVSKKELFILQEVTYYMSFAGLGFSLVFLLYALISS